MYGQHKDGCAYVSVREHEAVLDEAWQGTPELDLWHGLNIQRLTLPFHLDGDADTDVHRKCPEDDHKHDD